MATITLSTPSNVNQTYYGHTYIGVKPGDDTVIGGPGASVVIAGNVQVPSPSFVDLESYTTNPSGGNTIWNNGSVLMFGSAPVPLGGTYTPPDYFVLPSYASNPNSSIADQPSTAWFDSTTDTLKRGSDIIGPYSPPNYFSLNIVASNPGLTPTNTIWRSASGLMLGSTLVGPYVPPNYYVLPNETSNPNPVVANQLITLWYDSVNQVLKRGTQSIGPYTPPNYVQLDPVAANPGPVPSTTLWNDQGLALRWYNTPLNVQDVLLDILSGINISYMSLGLGGTPLSTAVHLAQVRYCAGRVTINLEFEWYLGGLFADTNVFRMTCTGTRITEAIQWFTLANVPFNTSFAMSSRATRNDNNQYVSSKAFFNILNNNSFTMTVTIFHPASITNDIKAKFTMSL